MVSKRSPKINTDYKKAKKAYHVGGIKVEFPYQPYGSQLAFMCRVISTLDRAQRDGHCHALLESPTGTGKSLSLLCSSLAWQHHYKLKNSYSNPSHSKPNPEAVTDALGCGGGFIPESQPSTIPPSANDEMAHFAAAPNNKNQKKKIVPVIFYASRTHSQISQVISEFKKTAYRVPMTVLASRKHYCTNQSVRGKENIDEECKLLLSDRDVMCPQFKNAHKVKSHPSLQKGGCHEVHDIEDLVKVGQVVRGCSYYAARAMANDAQLIFCPYNYIINPIIRGAMEIDIKGAIIIFDEAHNVEDIARDAGSVDIDEDALHKLQTELEQVSSVNPMIYLPLNEMTQDLIGWIERRKATLKKQEFQHYFSCWTGDKALSELEEVNISRQCFPILLECATKAIKEATDTESVLPHLSGMSVITLEGLFSALTYFFSRNGSHASDYQLALQRYVKRDPKNRGGNWTHTFSLWCLNPAVVFKDVAELSLSIILTSGTLSPMNSFSSELGVQFGICMEAPHVIDVDSQVLTTVIATSPDNYPLNASYKTADGYAFQDALGKSLEEICNVVPGGSLVFFPSYKLMEKLCNRWQETGQWTRLNAKKPLFVEPKGGSQEDFELILKDYYSSISHGSKHAVVRKRRFKKGGNNDLNTIEFHENTNKKGAGFLAVCRGKVSEGIDFSDDNARVVIVVGIPFPNINDIQVSLKKKYNDTYRSSKNLLSGNEWYCNQAFRALNQAIGRCIRHRFDYGAIILLDERFQEERNRANLTKWLRKSIRQYDSFDTSLEGLQSFFRNVKDRVGQKMFNSIENTDNDVDHVSYVDQHKELVKQNTPELNKYGAIVSEQKTECQFEVLTSVPNDQNVPSCIEYIDLESGNCINDENNHLITSSQGLTRKRSRKLINYENSGKKIHSLMKHDPFPKLNFVEEVEDAFIRVDKDTNSCKDNIDTQGIFQKKSRYFEASSTPFSNEVPELSLINIAPDMDDTNAMASPGSLSMDANSSPTIFQASIQSPAQTSVHSQSFKNLVQAPSQSQFEMVVVTPEKEVSGTTSNILLAIDSSLNSSVNSHVQKRRDTIFSPCVDLIPIASREAYQKIEFSLETNNGESRSKTSNTPVAILRNNCASSHSSSSLVMDKTLQISCSLCKSPLGLPENCLHVKCSVTSSSKSHLVSLLKQRHELDENVTNITVIVTDISSVDHRLQLCSQTVGSASEQGIWCEEDGCVYNTILCPFCSSPPNCLGVHIVASNSSNFQLLNKVLFYLDHLEIRNLKSKKVKSEDKDSSLITSSSMDKVTAFCCIDKFSYSPREEDSRGRRSTRSKLRLPKKGPGS